MTEGIINLLNSGHDEAITSIDGFIMPAMNQPALRFTLLRSYAWQAQLDPRAAAPWVPCPVSR